MLKNISLNRNIVIQTAILLLGAVLFLPGLGSVHLFDWDEINFAESAREMIVTGDYLTVQINFEPFWEKPPLFIWMQVLSMKIFGINEFAARFPNAICGIVTMLVLFNIGKRLKNERFGLFWVFVYIASLTPFFYFKSGIIDPWFNLFIFLGTYYFVCFTAPNEERNKYLLVALSAFFLGLAVLTKGPVGFLIFLLTFAVYLFVKRFKISFTWAQVLLFFAVLGFVGGFWFLLQIVNGNFSVIQDFIIYQIRLFETKDAGHGGFLLYHFVVLLVGVFPASVFALFTFKKNILQKESDENVAHFFRWMMILFWVVLILFTIVRTKIIHYSSMCYFPLTFLAAWYVERIIDKKESVHWSAKVLIGLLSFIFSLAIVVVPFIDSYKHWLYRIVDEFTIENLQATSQWYGFEWIVGVVLFVGTIYFIAFANKQTKNVIFVLFASSLIFIFSTMLFVVPQVEKYTQGAIIEFYESKRGEDCYMLSFHKSYAPYFYSLRQPENNCSNKQYLYNGELDKPCYFVVRNVQRTINKFEVEASGAELLYTKNGFSFYVRYPQNNLK
ncbi:MAG: glycosyltransferase family 39 protein [Paludibacteraceae bacterium]|nr:glycosyltransferase family 39 protein [Paludibacteraceae bacterium]